MAPPPVDRIRALRAYRAFDPVPVPAVPVTLIVPLLVRTVGMVVSQLLVVSMKKPWLYSGLVPPVPVRVMVPVPVDSTVAPSLIAKPMAVLRVASPPVPTISISASTEVTCEGASGGEVGQLLANSIPLAADAPEPPCPVSVIAPGVPVPVEVIVAPLCK